MKIHLLFAAIFISILLTPFFAIGARVERVPIILHQPDSTELHCFVSGDEYYHRVFDQNDFTIVQDHDGWYCYAIEKNKKLVSSGFKVGKTDPFTLTLQPGLHLSTEEYFNRRSGDNKGSISGPFTGMMTNIAIFIRFNDDEEFNTTREYFDYFFNAENQASLRSYYPEVSYNKLTIGSELFPVCPSGVLNISFQDTNNHAYYCKYNETTNPIGYSNNSERRRREKALIENAIYHTKSDIEAHLSATDIDINSDGYIDNIHFITRGDFDSWGEILWAHQNTISVDSIFIHGKEIRNYTLVPEAQQSVRISCHEVFHSLGAPDLYHYTYDGFRPVGPWDIMDTGSGHMLAYMKWKYSNGTWIEDIPLITNPTDIEIFALPDSTNQAVAIPSPYGENELFIMEYRKMEGLFEQSLPQEGLLIYRVDTTRYGNAGGPPDEIYIFRVNGNPNNNGNIYDAAFSEILNRTSFTRETDPFPFLKNGCPGNLTITDITISEEKITAWVVPEDPGVINDFHAQVITSDIILEWQTEVQNDSVLILQNTSSDIITPDCSYSCVPGDTLLNDIVVVYIGSENTTIIENADEGDTYYYKAFTCVNGNYGGDTLIGVEVPCNEINEFPYIESFEPGETMFQCWRQYDYGIEESVLWKQMQHSQFGDPPFHGTYMVKNPGIYGYNTKVLATPEIGFDHSKVYKLSYAYYNWNDFYSHDSLLVLFRNQENDDWSILKAYSEATDTWKHDSIYFNGLSHGCMIGFQSHTDDLNDVQIDLLKIEELNSDFYADTTWGAAPFEVQFFNTNPDNEYCLWDFGDGNSSTETNPVHTFQQSRAYTISLTTTFDTIPDTEIKENYIIVGYTETSENDIKEITIHPNPVKDYLHFKIFNEIVEKYEIRNIQGQCLKRGEINASSGKIKTDKIPEGIYFVSFHLTEKIITKKILIE